MAPLNQSAPASSSGRYSYYRRRIVPPPEERPTHSSSISSNGSSSISAVAAAELAASSIIASDNNAANGKNNYHYNNASASAARSAPSAVLAAATQRILRASRGGRLVQRRSNNSNISNQYQRWFKLKFMCFAITFVLGLFSIGRDGGVGQKLNNHFDYDGNTKQQQQQRDSSNSISKVNDGEKASLISSIDDKLSVGKSDLLLRHRNQSENKDPPKEIISADDNNALIAAGPATIMKQQQHHHHVIPPIVTFTYHTNLLTTPQSQLQNEEDVALSQNVREIIKLHPESTIRFLNDDDCLSSISYALGSNTNLTKYFTDEKHGMYKADICRGAALYETGGLYFDIDIETRSIPLWDVILPNTEFVTTLVHEESNHYGNFFQAFIGIIPHHPIMKRYLELFVEYYEGRVRIVNNGPLGVYFLRMAYDEIITKEMKHSNDKKRSSNTELWQEVRYSPKEFPEIHRNRWGKRRACQMMVVAPPTTTTATEEMSSIEGVFQRKQRMIPLFSHSNGSRMCGGKDTNRNGNSDTA